MKINRENYPLYFLDHFEGKLSEEGRGELMLFLEKHPDLKAEFEAFEMVGLEGDDHMAFPGKEALKKDLWLDAQGQAPVETEEIFLSEDLFALDDQGVLSVKPAQAETVLIAFAEGDLDKEQEEAVRAFLAANPAYRKDLELLRAARLRPEPAAAYPGKHALKRHPIGALVRRYSHTAAAAAAAVLMALIMWHFMPDHTTVEFTQDTPAGIDWERPEAVAEAPGRLQRSGQAMTPIPPHQLPVIPRTVIHPATTSSRLASLPADHQAEDPGEPGAYAALDYDSPTQRPLMASRMHSVKPQGVVGTTQRQHEPPRKRQEYYWLAYRDRSDLFAEDAGDPRTADRQQVTLAQLAMNELEGRTGLPLDQAEELLHTDASLLGRYARRGLGSINNLLGQPVVVDGETKPDGRTVTFAIGDFFEVSRK